MLLCAILNVYRNDKSAHVSTSQQLTPTKQYNSNNDLYDRIHALEQSISSPYSIKPPPASPQYNRSQNYDHDILNHDTSRYIPQSPYMNTTKVDNNIYDSSVNNLNDRRIQLLEDNIRNLQYTVRHIIYY